MTQTSSSSSSSETRDFNPYLPPLSDSPADVAAWNSAYAEWEASQAPAEATPFDALAGLNTEA